MSKAAIRSTIRGLIAKVADLERQRVGDEELLRDELDLDSLPLRQPPARDKVGETKNRGDRRGGE